MFLRIAQSFCHWRGVYVYDMHGRLEGRGFVRSTHPPSSHLPKLNFIRTFHKENLAGFLEMTSKRSNTANLSTIRATYAVFRIHHHHLVLKFAPFALLPPQKEKATTKEKQRVRRHMLPLLTAWYFISAGYFSRNGDTAVSAC